MGGAGMTNLANIKRTMTTEQREMMRGYYQRSIAIEQGKYPRPKGSSPMPWMLDEWQDDLNQLERVMRSNNELTR